MVSARIQDGGTFALPCLSQCEKIAHQAIIDSNLELGFYLLFMLTFTAQQEDFTNKNISLVMALPKAIFFEDFSVLCWLLTYACFIGFLIIID